MKTKDIILVGLFAALTTIGAFIKLPMGFSSFTLQFFFTALAGVLLGAKLGALSQLVYVLLGLIGLPIFTQGGGFTYIFNPTFGFLIGLIASAYVIGKLTEKKSDFKNVMIACIVGLTVLYLIGLPYMHIILTVYLGKAMSIFDSMKAGMLIFLPGDFVKIILVGLVSKKMIPILKANS